MFVMIKVEGQTVYGDLGKDNCMKRRWNRFFKGTVSFVLAGCLSFTGMGECLAQSLTAAGMEQEAPVAERVAPDVSERETMFCEEGFENGTVGKWLAKDGAKLSVESENPGNGKYCMKISNRTSTSAGAKLEIGDKLREGNYLTVSARVKYTSGPKNKKIQITMYCNGRYYVLAGREIAQGEWGQISGGMAVPNGVNLKDANIYFETPWTPAPSAEQDLMDIYVDDVRASMVAFCDTSNYPSLQELYKEQFRIGIAVPDAVLNTPEYSKLFATQSNSMTMENEMKPAYIMDQAASKNNLTEYKEHVALNFNAFKNGLEYAKNHDIAMRGHVLVWHSQTPDWFFYENYDTSGKLADRELMLKRMENYIKEVIAWTETNYPGVIYAWDVVNEAVADYFGAGPAPMRQEDSFWYQTIGEDFVQKAFAYARKYSNQYAGDRMKLFYNDYNEYFPAKRDGIIALLKPIKEAGNIDGLGMQSHFDTKRPLEGDDGYMTAVRKFRDELGLELHVTELDIGIAAGDSEASQGAYYQQYMEALLKEKRDGAKITSVTFWGLTDGLSWRSGDRCLLFYDDLGRKPAFEGVVNAIGNTGAVIDSIRNIGAVELTEACRERLAQVRKDYDSLTEAQRSLIPSELLTALTEAEEEYQRLEEEHKKQEEEDKNPPPAPKTALKGEHILQISSQVYTGKSLKPAVTVVCNGKKLVKDKDYTVTYKNNVNIGSAQAVVRGKGDYEGTASKSFSIIVKKNKVYTVGNYKYKITDARTNGKGCVTLTGIKNNAVKKKLKKIDVPATVRIGAKSFKVAFVGSGACQGCPKVANVTIGSNVKEIHSKAFYNCKKLKKVTIKTTKLIDIRKNALKNIHAKAVIKVPKRKLKTYRYLLKSTNLNRGVKISF